MSNAYILYGWHLSYFSGKMRCYLQHKRIRTWLKTLGGERLLDMKIPRLRHVGVLVGLEENAA